MLLQISQVLLLLQFTFQSGDIQIWKHYVKFFFNFIIYIPIWWYSNFTLSSSAFLNISYLHSNLVIFKYINIANSIDENKWIYIPIWWYSNFDNTLYPALCLRIYIPIWWYSNHLHLLLKQELQKDLHSNLVIFKCMAHPNRRLFAYRFTFQSGDIQIRYAWTHSGFLMQIYIPIWWYSN